MVFVIHLFYLSQRLCLPLHPTIMLTLPSGYTYVAPRLFVPGPTANRTLPNGYAYLTTVCKVAYLTQRLEGRSNSIQ